MQCQCESRTAEPGPGYRSRKPTVTHSSAVMSHVGPPSSSCATQGKAFKSNARSVCGHRTVPIRHKVRGPACNGLGGINGLGRGRHRGSRASRLTASSLLYSTHGRASRRRARGMLGLDGTERAAAGDAEPGWLGARLWPPRPLRLQARKWVKLESASPPTGLPEGRVGRVRCTSCTCTGPVRAPGR